MATPNLLVLFLHIFQLRVYVFMIIFYYDCCQVLVLRIIFNSNGPQKPVVVHGKLRFKYVMDCAEMNPSMLTYGTAKAEEPKSRK